MKRLLLALVLPLLVSPASAAAPTRPHIVLVMADDMGWGQTGYYNHPVLETPHLDAMAAAGLRFDRFYAGAPNCSPTRATVMTGRTNDRTGTENHGYALRRQEKTLAQALQAAGYVTGHFGKWHLNGYAGPGAPILREDGYGPGKFGFDEWLSVTNYFDRDPLLSRRGEIEDFKGDSSEIIVAEALQFLRRERDRGRPTFTVIWYGTPHSPFVAAESDKAVFSMLNEASQNHHGELVAMDRSIGALRAGLRELGLARDTLVWFCSDNGGLPNIQPGTVGPLRGSKNTLYEGGLRVPAVIEWPAQISRPRVTSYPAGTVDIFPTIADIVGLPRTAMLAPVDGISLRSLLAGGEGPRATPLGFRHTGRGAWVDNGYKIVVPDLQAPAVFELYDLEADIAESRNLARERPELAARLHAAFMRWSESVEASVAGRDYPPGKVDPVAPAQRDWRTAPEYAAYLGKWGQRPEYRQAPGKGKKKEQRK